MGNFIYVSPNLLRPTQDYLEQKKINSYASLFSGATQHIYPIPVKQNIINLGSYDILDGHHNLAVASSKFD